MAFSEYAKSRGIEWEIESLEQSASVTCGIGKDQVTVNVPEGNMGIEVRAVCRNMGANAKASVNDDMVQSSIFTSRSLDG